MTTATLATTTALALLAFAANSLLCRIALTDGGTDAASFAGLRLASGAAVLVALLAMRTRAMRAGSAPDGAHRPIAFGGHWRGGFALFAYAAGFSIAYVAVGAATGALLLFGAVQATMLIAGLWQGERLSPWQWFGFALALVGLAALLLPGAAAPPRVPALWMLGAGVAWGLYSLWGRGSADPIADTAGNFVRALPFAAAFVFLWSSLSPHDALRVDAVGFTCAVVSGALASGLGYALWYRVLPQLGALRAATLQLAVPPLAAIGGVLLLDEALDATRAVAAVVILGGIALVLRARR